MTQIHDLTDEPTERASDPDATPIATVSRRGWGKGMMLGASALTVLLAASKTEEAQAAPSDPWKLGGNSIATTGSEFLGTTNSAPLIIKTAGVERMRVTPTGNVGIGITDPSAKFYVYSTVSEAILGRQASTTRTTAGVRGDTKATVANAVGVLGKILSTTPGAESAAVRGDNASTGYNGTGVRGTHAGNGIGVHGTSVNGTGVFAEGGSTGVFGIGSETGVQGYGDYEGVYGYSNADGSYGVVGEAVSVGVQGIGNQYGVWGYSIGGTALYGLVLSSNTDSPAILGENGQYAVRGINGVTAGVRGDSGYVGVWGEGSTYGVYGAATTTSGTSVGVYGLTNSAGGYAGYFQGNVNVVGTLFKSAGSFKIDHPLDPANKYLSHSFVESPDMMNIYNGNVTLDAKGEAVVMMPAWFQALNMEFRYQLTAIGAAAPNLHVAQKVTNNRFKIAGGKAGLEVSWQMTGVRQDAYAKAHRIPTEEWKPAAERGRFMHPEVYGKPATMGIATARVPQATEHPRPQAPKLRRERPHVPPATTNRGPMIQEQ